MIKILIATLLIGMMGSCTEPTVEITRTDYGIPSDYPPLQIVNIDSCQYLFGDWRQATVLTHKGDCSNSIHKGGNK